VTGVRAAICRSYGPPEVVHVEAIPVPTLAAGQVRVRVRAAAVNFPDVLIIANEYQIKVPTPFVPGSELAGVVEEVADGVGDIDVGDRVVGTALVGAFAQEALVDARAVTRIPDGVDEHLAAAFGVAHRTAYHVLRSVARLQPGERLVVLGAGGGVGLAAVQLGMLLGASVTAVASSPAKLDVAASYGAVNLVDHRGIDLRQAFRECLPNGADVVVDPVGGDLSEPALRALRWGGRFVTVGYASGTIPRIPLNLVLLKGVIVRGMEMRTITENEPEKVARDMRELRELFRSGQIHPHVSAVYPLAETPKALQSMLDRTATGKVLIDPHA
jgi:NADPH2:quinone reductase